jgi:peroxiredoxin
MTVPALPYGRPAPDFSLPATTGATIALSGFQGKADVVLVFYCYDWGGI